MRTRSYFKFVLIGLILITPSLLPGTLSAKFQQGEAIRNVAQRQAVPKSQKQDDTKQEDKDKKDEKEVEDEGPVTDTKSLVSDKPEIPRNYVKFYMWDGSIVAGEVEFDSISVETEFGTLSVPIEKIRKLFPGLNSFPELNKKIDTLVQNLGNKDFEIREKSQRELIEMGVQIRTTLNEAKDGGNAERKKRLEKIKKAIDETLDDLEEGEEPEERELIHGDSVETPEFAIVGKIVEQTFTMQSKFGKLTVQLSDIKMAERSVEKNLESIKKSVAVAVDKFFQKEIVSTRIRVNKGDKISVKAEGMMNWTNWSNSCTPDGMANQGVYKGIKSGTLCARIGSNGSLIKVGAKHQWTAKKSGVLYLGVAMQDNYLQNNGYKWTGEYKTKVHVEPSVND